MFESLLQMPLLYEFEIDDRTLETLFDRKIPAHVRVYDAQECRIEVFIVEKPPVQNGSLNHLCFTVRNRHNIIDGARHLGFEIRQVARSTGDVIFIRDNDGNLYEIKEPECKNR